MRKWRSHFGQTLRFSSKSFFQITWRQPSHLTHRPSVRTFFSPEVSNSPDWRLNHVIVIVESSNCRTDELNSSSYFVNPKNLTIQKLVLDSPLCHHALFVGVLYLAHLRYRVGKFDNCRMGVAPRQDNMHHVRFLLEAFHDFARVEHPVADGVVDFVKNDQIPVAGLDCLFRFSPSCLHHLHIFGIWLFGPDLNEATAHLLHHELVAKSLNRIQFTVVPGPFKELQHQDLHSLSYRAKGGPHGGRRLTLSGTGIYDDEAPPDIFHIGRIGDCTCFATNARIWDATSLRRD